MLSKCANPVCSTQLHYLRDGKVFKVEMSRPVPIDSRKPLLRVEHFWLCGPCSSTQTLTYDQESGVRVLPKAQPKTVALMRRAAAS
jgi:hypothetical protein